MKIRVVSPWYPDYLTPHSGIFVAQQVAALRSSGTPVSVMVPQVFPAPRGPLSPAVIDAMGKLASRDPSAMFHTDDDITYVPTPVPSRSGFAGRARAMAATLRMAETSIADHADLIHAHLGVPTGWAVDHAEREAPLVVTEHQSTLEMVFAEPAAAEMYASVVRSADAFLCVSGHLRDQIVEALGDWALERIAVVPNIVDLSGIPLREERSPGLKNWIYVGGLVEHKGVRKLLESFADYRRRHEHQAHLTLVGEGPLRGWISSFTTENEIEDSVRLTGAIDHGRLPDELIQADIMVHLSPAETFGIAPLEAIGAGLPVVGLRHEGAVATWGEIEPICGTMLDPNASPDIVADAVAQLRQSQQRLDPVRARQHVEDNFSPSAVLNHLMAVYTRVLT